MQGQAEQNEVLDGTAETEKRQHVALVPQEEIKDVKDTKREDPLALIEEEARMLCPNKCFAVKVCI